MMTNTKSGSKVKADNIRAKLHFAAALAALKGSS
jgi:hypothetical protein